MWNTILMGINLSPLIFIPIDCAKVSLGPLCLKLASLRIVVNLT